MAIHTPVKGLTVLLAVVMAVLMVFVVASGAVEAAPLQTSSTPVGSWSYGAVKTVSVGPLKAADNWTYQGNATFGYTVTMWENNTTPTTFEITILRTMGAAFSVQFCFPSCSSPTNWVNLSYRAWETTTGFSNFTTKGSVVEGKTGAVPAIALLNSTVILRGNLTESYNAFLPKLHVLGDRTGYLAASIASHSTVNFSAPLGLFPIGLTPGTSWSSTSPFNESGAGTYSYFYSAHAPLKNTTIPPTSGAISLGASGSVTVDGAYAVGSTVSVGGVTYPAITLTVIGPFSVREGVVFVPSAADLFGPSSHPWTGNENGTASAQMSHLDLTTSEAGHLDLAASSWVYDSSSANPADSATTAVSSPEVASSSVATSNPVSTTTLQGGPQTDAQATLTQQCLTAGSGCPVGPAGSSPRSIFGEVVVVGAVASIGALVALAVVARWRKMPPPAYLNAPLYPPGQTGPSAAARAPATPGAPPPTEDDPLDHLW